jgi:hypothetical protein
MVGQTTASSGLTYKDREPEGGWGALVSFLVYSHPQAINKADKIYVSKTLIEMNE